MLDNFNQIKRGGELYLIHIPDNGKVWSGKYFFDKLKYEMGNIMLFAIKSNGSDKVIINPDPNKTSIYSGNIIWVVSKDRPININWGKL